MLSGFASNRSNTLGHIMVDLKVGPLRSPTRFHILEEETRKEATQRLLTIAQKYGKPLHINMVRHVT